MIRLSGADLQLGSTITAITPGFSRRYRLSISHSAADEDSDFRSVEFDKVIIATPLSAGDIDLDTLNIEEFSLPLRHIESHVTHFSSSVPLTANLSILPLDISIMDEVTLTSSASANDLQILNLQRDWPCFRRYRCSPGDECDQCDKDELLYRVHSLRHLEDEDLVWMIGQQMKKGKKLSDYGIGYAHRQSWPNAFPQARDGQLDVVEEVEIAPSLYYLNGAEAISPFMEMSCRMGTNVAEKARSQGPMFML